MQTRGDERRSGDMELGRRPSDGLVTPDPHPRHSSMDLDDQSRPRESSWLYRSTQDAESLANLDGVDWAELRASDGDTVAPILPSTSRSLCVVSAATIHDCTLPKLKKQPSNSNLIDTIMAKSSKGVMTKQKQKHGQQWTTCVTPVTIKDPHPQAALGPLIHVAWVLGSVASVSSTLVGAALYHSDVLRSGLSLESFPRATLILVVHIALGVSSFVGGVVGDRAIHRMHVVRGSVWLWCIGAVILAVGGHPFVASRGLYVTGLILAFVAAGGLMPNLVATVSLGPIFLQCALVQLAGTSLTHGLFTPFPPASTMAYILIALLTLLSTATLVGMHLATYRRWLGPAPAPVASLGVYVSRISLLWRGYLAGVLCMIVGGAVCAMSLVCVHDDSRLYGSQFAVATAGVILVVVGWLWTLFWGVAMVHPSGALWAWAAPSSLVSPPTSPVEPPNSIMSPPDLSDSIPPMGGQMDCLAPILAMAVFSSFVRGQLYTMYILQACQCSLRLVGGITYTPEYTAVIVHVVALAVAPGVPRMLPRLPPRLGLAMLLYLIASFLSGIVELYRRSSSRIGGHDLELVDRTGPTCYKNPSVFSILWTTPQLALVGISEGIFQSTVGYVVHQAWPPMFRGLGHGLLALCHGVGYSTALGISMVVARWFTAPAPADLVLVFLLVTSMGCAVIACMKRLLVLDERHRIWPDLLPST